MTRQMIMCRQFFFCFLKSGFFIERNITYSDEVPRELVMEVCCLRFWHKWGLCFQDQPGDNKLSVITSFFFWVYAFSNSEIGLSGISDPSSWVVQLWDLTVEKIFKHLIGWEKEHSSICECSFTQPNYTFLC